MGSLARKVARGLLRKRRTSNSVSEQFKRGEQGVWLDPSDHSTLFQDVAGSVPITAPGQQVALARDKSGRGNHFVQPVALARPVLQTDGLGHWWLAFDGVDDFMVSAAPLNLSSTSKLAIIAGLRSDPLTGSSIWAELSTISNSLPGAFYVGAPVVSTGTQYGTAFYLGSPPGVSGTLQLRSEFLAVPRVVTYRVDTSVSVRSRIDGGGEVNTATTRGGNFAGTQKLYLGARAGTSAFFKGRLYSLVIRGAETADAQVIPGEAFIADKMGLVPLISVASGSGYAGSVLSVDKAPGQWFANGIAIPDATGQQLTVTLDLEDADITYKWLGISSLPFRMWTPARAGIHSVFDIRKVAAGATEWLSKDGLIRYTQPNESIRPVYEATGLGGAPCVYHDWNRTWVINGLLPAPEARTFIGCMAFLASDPVNSANVIARSVAGAWTIRKTYLSGGKRQIAIAKGWDSEWQGSSWAIEDAAVYLVSAKTKRPSGEFAFRLNGVEAGSGTSAVSAFADGGSDGVYTIGGYLRLGSHAYVDRFLSVEDEINFEGWCGWTSGQVSRLPADHPRKNAPVRIS